jgi:hypothetical protein
MKVFLGGTVNGSKWRDEIIPKLKVDYFNPVVEEWNEEAQKRELDERENSEYCLYVLTPKMLGFYSIAEVTDDSYRKADKTIFCYINEDDGLTFSQDQLESLEKLGKLVTSNGGLWKSTLNEVVGFLNSASETAAVVKGEKSEFKDVFISYGRRHSLAFARKLFYRLNSFGYSVWFDMNDIPIGVDFQEEIDEGIQKADNFIFIISPHSVNSIYCYKEIVLAKKYNKRIIPILHVEPEGLWNKLHPDISKINWIYSRQQEDFNIALEQWKDIDDFNPAFQNVITLIEDDKAFVNIHTLLLDKALYWIKNQKQYKFLLNGDFRLESLEWLLKRDFRYPDGKTKQAPVFPTELQAEFIIESKKNAENLMTDCFIAYIREDFEVKELIRKHLNLNGISTWSDTSDIKKGTRFKDSIEKGVAEADNFLFLISPLSANAKEPLYELDLAIKYKKRIIPVLISETPDNDLPLKLRALQYINFINRAEKIEILATDHKDVEAEVDARKEASPLQKAVSELLIQLNEDKHYYHYHKIYLAQSLKWQSFNKPDSMLLRDESLENAQSWLKLSENQLYKSNHWQKELIETSQAKAGTIDSEIYISYSRSDSDFVRKLNYELQAAGIATWVDEEIIGLSNDFEKEIKEGIEKSNNFIFIVSPNSVASPNCRKEIDLAIENNKRIITLLISPTTISSVHEHISKIQWIDFYSKDASTVFSELVRVLETDKEHVKLHNFYARAAKRWLDEGKNNDYALRGKDMESAQQWLDISDNERKNPSPSSLHREFIERSTELLHIQLQKETQQKRIKRLLIFVMVLSIIALLFGATAYYNFVQSEKQKKIAVIESQKAKLMADEARKQAVNAEEQKKFALAQKAIAEEQTQIALKEKYAALIARRMADSARVLADSARATAEEQRQIAMTLKQKAEYNEKWANKQKNIAEHAEEVAQYYLYAFNSKNMANEAISNSNRQMQAFLSTTSLELNYVADSLANKFGIENPYIPSIMQALQVCFAQSQSTNLLNDQTKALMINNNKLYYGKAAGGLAESDIQLNSKGELSLGREKLLTSPEIGNVYSIISIEDKIYFNTSFGGIYYLFNGKIFDITIFLSSNSNKLIKLPSASQMEVKLNNGKSILFDASQFSSGITFGHQISETSNFDLSLLSKLSHIVNLANSSYIISSLVFLKSSPTVYTNTGNGTILMTNGNNSEEFPQGHTGQIAALAISNDENWLASGSFDGSIMIWYLGKDKNNTSTLLPITLHPPGTKYINSLCFSEDNAFLIYADNNSISYYPMNIELMYKQILNQSKVSINQQKKWWEYYKRGEIYRYKGSIF